LEKTWENLGKILGKLKILEILGKLRNIVLVSYEIWESMGFV
jgi:hypothetical protein